MRAWQNQQYGIQQCESCPGGDAPYPLGGIGDEDADVMLVAMEPAYNIDSPLVDGDEDWDKARTLLMMERKRSSNPLWRHMECVADAAGCDPSELYFTNLAKCNTPDSSFEERFGHCDSYFPEEVADVDPKLIIGHGSKVCNVLDEWLQLDLPDHVPHGEVFRSLSQTVLILYHWGYAHRNGTVDEYREVTATNVEELT